MVSQVGVRRTGVEQFERFGVHRRRERMGLVLREMGVDRMEDVKVSRVATGEHHARFLEQELGQLHVLDGAVGGEEDLHEFAEAGRVVVQCRLSIAERLEKEVHRHEAILQRTLFTEPEQSEFTDEILGGMGFT